MNNSIKYVFLVLVIMFFLPQSLVFGQQSLTTVGGWNAYVKLPSDYSSNTSTYYPTIIFIPGLGEVGTNASKLLVAGPSKFIQNGWDGKVIVDGTTIDPIIISLQPSSSYPVESTVSTRIQTLKSQYRIDSNKLYLTGLSMGGWTALTFVTGDAYDSTPPYGPFSYASQVKAVVGVQSVKPADNSPYPDLFDNFARAGGKLLAFEQVQDGRDTQTYVNRMNSIISGSAIFKSTSFGSGGHCCWDEFYDPTKLFADLDGRTESIYQWMLRQGGGSSTPPPTNTAPTANAGTDQTITLPTSSVTLSGSGTDTGGSISSYAWTKISGTGGTISSSSSASTTITGLTQGSYTFRLTVTDNGGLTDTDDVNIVVNAQATTNNAPVANAGTDKTITLPTSSVSFSGSATDPDGDSMTYSWTKISGGSATISSPSSLNTNVTGLVEGTYTFWLTVTDSKGATNADAVAVIVNPATSGGGTPSSSYLIDFGSPYNTTSTTGWTNVSSANINTAVSLVNESGSSSGVTLTITDDFWSAGNPSANVNGTTSSSLYPSSVTGDSLFLGTLSGYTSDTGQFNISGLNNNSKYNFTFYASRMAGDGGNRTARYTIGSQSVTLNATDNINGTVSITNISPSNGSVVIAVTRVGTYGYLGALVVSESGSTPPPSSNNDPIANAGTDQTITLPTSSVTLSGSGTDTGGSISSYAWTKISGTGGTISSSSSASTTITGLTQGSYTFRLTVTDNGGLTDTDDIIVTVNGSSFGTNTCSSKKIVILGSSTAAGTGASPTSNGWAWRFKTYFEGLASGNSVDNLAYSGYTTYNILPTGSSVPSGFTVGTSSNISSAISRNPCAIIINMPSNDEANNIPLATQQANWNTIASATQNTNIPIFVTTTQPREWPLTNQGRQNLMTMRDWINTRFGSNSIDFWTTIADSDGNVNATYDSDGVHVNNLGHELLFNRVIAENIPGIASTSTNDSPVANAGTDKTITLPTSSVTLSGSGTDTGGSISSYAWTKISGTGGTISSSSSASTTITGLTQGSYTFRLTVTDNGGLTATDDVVVTVNSSSGTCKTVSSAGIIPSGGTDFWFMGNFNTTYNLNPCDTVILQAGTYGRIDIGIVNGITFVNSGQVIMDSFNLYPGSKNVRLLGNGTSGIKYGIKINGANSFATYWKATGDLEIAYIEVVGTAAGIEVKHPPGEAYTQNFANVKIHDNYIHDHRLEGMYIGMDNLALDVLINAEIYNNIVKNSGNDGIQTRNGTFNIHDNVIDNVAVSPAFPYDINGILVGGNTKNSIIHNNTVSRVPGTAIFNNGWGNHTISCNVISSTQPGIFTKNYEFTTEDLQDVGFQNFTIQNNTITSSSGIALQSYYNSNGSTTTTNFSNNKTSGSVDSNYSVTKLNNSSSVAPNCSSVPVPTNTPPSSNAGTDQSITLPINSVGLAGSGSDIDGTISKYAWTKVSGTGGTITSSSSASTTVTGLTQGSYTFRLTVTDNGGLTATDDVVVTVSPVVVVGGGTGTGGTGGGTSSGGGGGGGGGGSSSGSGTVTNSNRSPVVNAGSDVTIKSPTSSVTLSGNATDPDGSIKSYEWKKVSGSSAEIQSLTKSSTKVLGLKVGSYTFRLTATDDKKSSAYDDVNVTVVSSTSTASVGYSSSSSSSNNSGSSSTVKVIATELNVRSTPGGSVVGKVQSALTGEIVSTKEEVKDGISWIQITFKNGLKGWVSSKYISKVASTTSSVNTPTTSSGKPSSSLPTTGVNKLSNLQDVKTLQTFLNWVLGSKITPLVVDGKYGPKTTETIRLYQSMNGLTADGLFGKNSSSKANSLISN